MSFNWKEGCGKSLCDKERVQKCSRPLFNDSEMAPKTDHSIDLWNSRVGIFVVHWTVLVRMVDILRAVWRWIGRECNHMILMTGCEWKNSTEDQNKYQNRSSSFCLHISWNFLGDVLLGQFNHLAFHPYTESVLQSVSQSVSLSANLWHNCQVFLTFGRARCDYITYLIIRPLTEMQAGKEEKDGEREMSSGC